MNETKIDYLSYVENAKKVLESKIKWKPSLLPTFLEHTLPILSSVPLVLTPDNQVSSRETFLQLKDIDYLNTPNGKMTGLNVFRLIMFIYYAKRGDLIHGSQNKNPRLASLTPIFMYAHKLYNNVPYSRWDAKDPHVSISLGRTLEPLLKVDELPNPRDYDLKETRELALTYRSGKRAGELSPITGYKCNLRHIGDIELPNIAMMMILQLWIANASLRNVESMILHPINWGEVPTPIDSAIPEPPKRCQEEELISWY